MINRKITSSEDFQKAWFFAFASVCWCLVTSRWGSYLPKNPVFFNDILIGLAIICFVFNYIARINKARSDSGFTLLSIKFFVVFAALMLAYSNWDEPILTLRDYAPFLYLGIALMIPFYRREIYSSELTLSRILKVCLTLHAIWFSVAVYFPAIPKSLPLVSVDQNLHILSTRNDFDCAISAVMVGVLIVNANKKRFSLLSIISICIIVGAITATGTRAGFLSLAIVVIIALVIRDRNFTKSASLRLPLFAIASIVSAVAFIFIPDSIVGQRSASLFDSETLTSSLNEGGLGTARARLESWPVIVRYTNEYNLQLVFGVGFGKDFMRESGALVQLVGNATSELLNPRSPHNYLLTVLVRLGVVGLALFLSFLIAMVKITYNLIRYSPLNETQLISIFGFISILIVSLFGVVMEAPFGAIPFAFFCGILQCAHIRTIKKINV